MEGSRKRSGVVMLHDELREMRAVSGPRFAQTQRRRPLGRLGRAVEISCSCLNLESGAEGGTRTVTEARSARTSSDSEAPHSPEPQEINGLGTKQVHP